MPGMPSQNLDPTNAHLKAAGQRLQDARLAQDISVDTVMRELRVTRLQIAGIESGNPKSFYNETFFVDLLKRYARLLNFSETAIAKMVTPPVLEVIESSPVATAPAESESSVDESTGQATGQLTNQVTNDVTAEADDAKDAQALDSTDASPKSGSRWMGLLALVVLVGAGIAVGLQVTDSSQPSTVASAPAAVTATPSTSPTPEAGSPPAATGAEPAAPAAKPVAEPVIAAPAPAPASAPTPTPALAGPAPVPSAASKPAEIKPAAPSPEKLEAEQEQTATKTIVDTPMVLTAKRKSWIWVRDASDQVRQFGVAEGQTVKFDQLPIYIVVHDPTGFEVVIGNKVIPLVRNNEERNVARHTRTDLINFYK
jgi:transcriptional regulator with XRE-family HTH domain